MISESPAQKITSFFDLLAFLCHLVNHHPEKKDNQTIQSFLQATCDAYNKERGPKTSSFIKLLGENYTKNTYLQQDSQLDQKSTASIIQEAEKNPSFAVAGIDYIDRHLHCEIESIPYAQPALSSNCTTNSCISNHYYKLLSLNPNTSDDYGIILPRYKCAWEKYPDSSPDRSNDSNRIIRNREFVERNPLYVLCNYLWIPTKFSNYTIHNFFYHTINPLIDSLSSVPPKSLPIICSPISKEKTFSVTTNMEKLQFYISYDTHKIERENSIIKQLFREICKSNTCISLLPELIGNEGVETLAFEEIRKSWYHRAPFIFLLPTYEYCKDGENKYINELAVLDEDGNVFFRYHKQHPFILTNEQIYYEPITADNHLIVIHIKHIGRIGILICSDIFDKDIVDLLCEHLKLSLLLHPSFSIGEDLLQSEYGRFQQNKCDILLCNACSIFEAYDKSIDRSYCPCKYFSYGHRTTSTVPGSICNQTECHGCYFIVNIPPQYKDSPESIQHVVLSGG